MATRILAMVLFLLTANLMPVAAAAGLSISHTQTIETTVACSKDIEVLAEAQNAARVTLHVRPKGQVLFTDIPMELAGTPGQFRGWIPAGLTVEPGVDYFISAMPTIAGKASEGVRTPVFSIWSERDLVAPLCPTAMAAGDYFYDLQYFGGSLPSGYWIAPNSARSPVRNADGTDSYPAVTSKMAETRSTDPNPHNGIDLDVKWVPVRAAQAGNVVWYGTSSGINMVIIGHGNYNPSTNNAEYYSRYLHLASIGSLKVGDPVTTSTQLGVSGDSGSPGAYHLDFSFYIKDGAGRKRFMPGQYFYSGASAWNNPMDLDFTGPPYRVVVTGDGTYIRMNAYPKGTRDSQTLYLTIYYREQGTSTWSSGAMYRIDSYGYDYRMSGRGLDGKYVEVYIKVEREGVVGRQWRPLQYGLQAYEGDREPTIYYLFFIQGG